MLWTIAVVLLILWLLGLVSSYRCDDYAGNVVLQGFANSRETEERLVTKLRDVRSVRSGKSLLKVEEKSKGGIP